MVFGSLEVFGKLNEGGEGLIKEILLEDIGNIELFDDKKFEQVFQSISEFSIDAPVKEKFMKDSEYKALLADFQNNSTKSMVYKLEVPIEVGDCKSSVFCYLPDYELFQYLVYNRDYGQLSFDFNKRIDSEVTEGATVLQQNLGKTSNYTILNTSKDELVINGMNDFFVLPKILRETCIKKPERCFVRGVENIFQNLNQVKNDFENYKAFLVFKVDYEKQENRYSRSSTSATISSPIEKNETIRKIYGVLQGLSLEYKKLNIYESGNFNVTHTPYFAYPPKYPRAAKRKKLSGSATVSFTYNPKDYGITNVKFVEGFCATEYEKSKKVLLNKTPCDLFKKTSVKYAKKYLRFHIDEKSPLKERTLYHTYEFFYEENPES